MKDKGTPVRKRSNSFQVFIKDVKTHTIKITSDISCDILKDIVSQKFNIDKKCFWLSHNGKSVYGEKSIKHRRIAPLDTIWLLGRLPGR